MRVVVVGGGIGGLALTIALQQRDVEVVLLERAEALTEVGAGIWLQPSAVKALDHLDVDISATSVATRGLAFCDFETDELLYATDATRAQARYGAGAFFVHRADLLDALVARVDPAALAVASEVVAVEQAARRATVVLSDGTRVTGDAVVGADGINSTVRAGLFGDEAPEFSGIVAWRSIIPFDRIAHLGLEPAHQHLFLGSRRTTISYPLRGNTLYNFVGLVPAEEVTPESWSQAGRLDDLRASLAGACARLAGIVDAIDSAFVTGLSYRPPLRDWGVGRIGLTGDAAHPALPTAGLGAAMALEDAVVLADCLVRHGAERVDAGFAWFADRRRARTGRVLGLSRANAEMLTFDTPQLSRARNGRWRGMRALDPVGLDFWQWAWSYDVGTEIVDAGTDASRPGAVGADPELERAGALWARALQPGDRARGWVGERDAYARFWAEQAPVDPVAEVHADRVGGVDGLRVRRPGAPPAPVVVHLHGGGFTMGSAATASTFADRLAMAVGGTAFCPDYRLAPEAPFPAALEDAIAACRAVIDDVGGGRVLLSGDGAGGGLALATAVALRDAGHVMPGALYLASPLCDLALRGGSIDAAFGLDRWYDREQLSVVSASYLQGGDPTTPQASPLYADLSGLPPMLVHAAAREALADDARRVVARARAAGVDARLALFDHAVHAFVLFPFLADAQRALDDVEEWAGHLFAEQANTGRVINGSVPERTGGV